MNHGRDEVRPTPFCPLEKHIFDGVPEYAATGYISIVLTIGPLDICSTSILLCQHNDSQDYIGVTIARLPDGEGNLVSLELRS